MRSPTEECTACGWQGVSVQLSGGCCPECGGEAQPLDQIYADEDDGVDFGGEA